MYWRRLRQSMPSDLTNGMPVQDKHDNENTSNNNAETTHRFHTTLYQKEADDQHDGNATYNERKHYVTNLS